MFVVIVVVVEALFVIVAMNVVLRLTEAAVEFV